MVQKIFNNWLFRVMSTWFGFYVTTKFQAAQPWLSIINVGTADNVAQINDAFADDPTATSKTLTQQWPGESEPSQHIVYPQIMYIGGL
jgi:hypothetical protein